MTSSPHFIEESTFSSIIYYLKTQLTEWVFFVNLV